MAITTNTQIKTNYLNISGSTYDSILTALIAQAESIMKSMCYQPLSVETGMILEFTGNGSTEHLLSYTVPVSLTSLEYKEKPSDASWTSVTGAVAYKADDVQRLYLEEGFVYPFYRATADIGYSTVPDDLVNICSEMVVELFKATDYTDSDNRFGLASLATNEGGMSATTTYRDMMARYKDKLKKYKRRSW